MKLCNTCGTDKCESEFGARKASIDGLSPKCKFCQRAYDKTRSNKPSRVEARAEYAKTSSGIESRNKARKKYASNNKEKIAEIHKKYIANNPKKRAAHKCIEKLVRLGKVSIQPCEVCGSVTVVGHHDDYDKPIDIRWLCPKHHNQWHAENGPGLNG